MNTHVKPNEAQGVAGSPNFSTAHTGSGFHWGIHMLRNNGVQNVPGYTNDCTCDIAPGIFGQGYQKP